MKNMWPKQHQPALLGVLNDEFVAGLTGFMAVHLPWSHFIQLKPAVAVVRSVQILEN